MNSVVLIGCCLVSLVLGIRSLKECEPQSDLYHYADVGDAEIPEGVTMPMRLPRVHLDDDNAIDSTRIYNGDRADDEQFPYNCQLECFGPKAVGYCGCSILSENYLLTAAHCVFNKWFCNVGYGSNYVKEMKSVEARHFFIHPLFNETLILHDVAVIGLTCNNSIQFSDKVKPVKLPKGCDSFVNKTAFVAGFGETQRGKFISYFVKFSNKQKSICFWLNTKIVLSLIF